LSLSATKSFSVTAIQSKGIVYDATAMSRILSIPAEGSDPVPEAVEGEIVVCRIPHWHCDGRRCLYLRTRSIARYNGQIVSHVFKEGCDDQARSRRE
jgi:hypothetical protein